MIVLVILLRLDHQYSKVVKMNVLIRRSEIRTLQKMQNWRVSGVILRRENVWGTWNGIVPQDGEAIRRVGSMLRFFGGRNSSYCWNGSSVDYLHSPDWIPHVQGTMQAGIFASKFPATDGSAVYTFVNRGIHHYICRPKWFMNYFMYVMNRKNVKYISYKCDCSSQIAFFLLWPLWEPLFV